MVARWDKTSTRLSQEDNLSVIGGVRETTLLERVVVVCTPPTRVGKYRAYPAYTQTRVDLTRPGSSKSALLGKAAGKATLSHLESP